MLLGKKPARSLLNKSIYINSAFTRYEPRPMQKSTNPYGECLQKINRLKRNRERGMDRACESHALSTISMDEINKQKTEHQQQHRG